MKKRERFTSYFYVLFVALMLSSCVSQSHIKDWSKWSVYVLFALIIFSFIATFILIYRTYKQENKKMTQYVSSVSKILNKCKNDNEKIHKLETLILRIQNDNQYKKDVAWKNKVLAKTYEFLATIYYRMNDDDNTLRICSLIIEVSPKDFITLTNRGSLYLKRGEFKKAINDFTSSIAINNSYADSYNNRGKVYELLGETEKALEDYKYALSLDQTAVIQYNIGNVLSKMNNKQVAKIHLSKAKELCEKDISLSDVNRMNLSKKIDELLSKL